MPVVALRIRVPATSAPDAELQYRLIVENTSRAPAHHVVVRNPLPANLQFVRATPEPTDTTPELRWQLGTLEPAARKEIILVVKPIGSGEVRNTARVQFEHGQSVTTRIGMSPAPTAILPPMPTPMPTARPTDEAKVTPRPVDEGRSELRLRMTGPTQAIVEVGPLIDYRSEITNVGNATAKGVVLTYKLPAGLDYSTSNPSVTGDQMGVVTWKLGDLAPGQTRQVVCTVIPKTVGKYSIEAEVHDATGRNAEASSNVAVGEPKLSVVTTGPKLRLVNRPATYVTTVSNPGTMPLANVVVTSEVTEGMTMVSASVGGFISPAREREDKLLGRNVKYQVIRWEFRTLAPGEKKKIEMVLQTANPGTLDHRVNATADRNLEQRSDFQTVFEEATGLTLEVEKSADPIEVGGKMTFKVRVLNQGGGGANNIGLTLFVPEEMAILKDKLDSKATVEGQKVTFPILPGLASKSTKEFVVEVQAVKAGQVQLKTELICDQLRKGGPVTSTESTTIFDDTPGK